MGVLTDFVVADASEAQRLGDHREQFDGLAAKGIDQVRMGTLYAILAGTEYDDSFLLEDESFAYAASEDGPWVQRVPDDMVGRLAALSDADVRRVGDEWMKTEEFDPRYSRWSRDDVDWFLKEIRQLSARAVSEKKALFMWTSL